MSRQATIRGWSCKPGMLGFKPCSVCGRLIPKSDGHKECVSCLGNQHPVSSCPLCARLLGKSLQSRYSSMCTGGHGLIPEETHRWFQARVSPGEKMTSPDALFRIKKGENLCMKNSQNTDGREQKDSISTGLTLLNSETCLMKEDEPVFIDNFGMEVRDKSTNPMSEHEVVPFDIKEEKEPYCMANQEGRITEISSSPTAGDGSMTRKLKDKDSTNPMGKKLSCNALSGNSESMVPETSEKGTHYTCQVWSESGSELYRERTLKCYTGFNAHKDTHSILLNGSNNDGRSDNYDEFQSNVRNEKLHGCLQNVQQNQTPCTVSENSLNGEKGKLVRLVRENTGAQPFTCIDCEKRFSLRGDLAKHRRIHTKPHTCTDCQKRFSLRAHLNRHRRLHTGEKPYTCTDCQKSYSRKDRLNEHIRIHIGCRKEDPFSRYSVYKSGVTEK